MSLKFFLRYSAAWKKDSRLRYVNFYPFFSLWRYRDNSFFHCLDGTKSQFDKNSYANEHRSETIRRSVDDGSTRLSGHLACAPLHAEMDDIGNCSICRKEGEIVCDLGCSTTSMQSPNRLFEYDGAVLLTKICSCSQPIYRKPIRLSLISLRRYKFFLIASLRSFESFVRLSHLIWRTICFSYCFTYETYASYNWL